MCQDGVHSLRRVIRQLCTEFSTREEFDSCDSYLSFRELSTLHQFMMVEGVSAQGEMKDVPSFETLESLKVLILIMTFCYNMLLIVMFRNFTPIGCE